MRIGLGASEVPAALQVGTRTEEARLLGRGGVTRFAAAVVTAVLGFAGLARANADLDLQACYDANDRGDYPAAIEACTRALESGDLSNDDAALALNDRGNAYNRNGDFDRAIDSYNEAIRRKPNYADAYFDRANAYDFKDEYERAVKDYSKAIALRPDDANAYLYRGNSRSLAGDYANAIRDYDKSIKLAPSYADVAIWSKGQALFNLGRFSDAAAAFRTYLQARPDYAFGGLWLYLAEAHLGKDGRAALADRAQSLDLRQWPGPIVRYYLGAAARDEVMATARIGDPAYLDQQACEAAFYLGAFNLTAGNAEDARRDLTKAATQCPKSSAERGAAQSELGRK